MPRGARPAGTRGDSAFGPAGRGTVPLSAGRPGAPGPDASSSARSVSPPTHRRSPLHHRRSPVASGAGEPLPESLLRGHRPFALRTKASLPAPLPQHIPSHQVPTPAHPPAQAGGGLHRTPWPGTRAAPSYSAHVGCGLCGQRPANRLCLCVAWRAAVSPPARDGDVGEGPGCTSFLGGSG